MEWPSTDGGEARQGLEVLEEHLRQRGEFRAPADVIEIGHQPAVGSIHDLSSARLKKSARLEHHEVSKELFTIEVGQRPSLLRVQTTSGDPHGKVGPKING
jgi:hypothetical protein